MAETTTQALAGRKILLLPRYTRSGPSSRLRMYQFIPALEAAGAEIEVEPFFDEAYLDEYFGRGIKSRRHTLAAFRRRFKALRRVGGADAVWIEKEVFPYLPGLFEGLIKAKNRPYVVDYDDPVFHTYDRSRNPLIRWALSRKLDPLLAGAACVTAGNDYLARYASEHGARRVAHIPTVVDSDRYPVVAGGTQPPLRVGWIGTPANAKYLQPVVTAINRLKESLPIRLVTIGAPPLESLEALQESHPWSEETEAALLSRIDIGVMPLADDYWERGKCGYKLIQYMAAGKPIVASPVGVNKDIVSPDVGYLASSVDDWVAAIAALAAEPERRARMGVASRARVEADYSIKTVAPRIIAIFEEIMAKPAGPAAT